MVPVRVFNGPAQELAPPCNLAQSGEDRFQIVGRAPELPVVPAPRVSLGCAARSRPTQVAQRALASLGTVASGSPAGGLFAP